MRRHTTHDPIRAARHRDAIVDDLVMGLSEANLEALIANWDTSKSMSANLAAFRTLSSHDAVPGRLAPSMPDAFTRTRDELAKANDPRRTPGYEPTGKPPSAYDAALDARRRKGARS